MTMHDDDDLNPRRDDALDDVLDDALDALRLELDDPGAFDDDEEAGDVSDRFVALLRDAGRTYHRPPDVVPRDAMWEAIVAARGARDAATPVAPLAAPAAAPRVLPFRRPASAPLPRWTLAAAAAALLAVGVTVGRSWEHRQTTSPATVAAAPSARPAATAPTPDSATAIAATPEPSSAPDGDGARTAPRDRDASGLAASRLASARGALRAPTRMSDRTGRVAYDVETLRHLTQVEALLVAYRADSVDAETDARVATWARQLLQDTRLLLDSPAARDPRRRRLLEDLELVLVQMAHLSPADSTGRDRAEREMIDGTMRDARVLPRLRRAIPAGVGT